MEERNEKNVALEKVTDEELKLLRCFRLLKSDAIQQHRHKVNSEFLQMFNFCRTDTQIKIDLKSAGKYLLSQQKNMREALWFHHAYKNVMQKDNCGIINRCKRRRNDGKKILKRSKNTACDSFTLYCQPAYLNLPWMCYVRTHQSPYPKGASVYDNFIYIHENDNINTDVMEIGSRSFIETPLVQDKVTVAGAIMEECVQSHIKEELSKRIFVAKALAKVQEQIQKKKTKIGMLSKEFRYMDANNQLVCNSIMIPSQKQIFDHLNKREKIIKTCVQNQFRNKDIEEIIIGYMGMNMWENCDFVVLHKFPRLEEFNDVFHNRLDIQAFRHVVFRGNRSSNTSCTRIVLHQR